MKQRKDIWATPMTKEIREMIHSYGSLKPLDSSLTDMAYFQDFAKRYNNNKPKRRKMIMEQDVKKIDVRNDQERKRDSVCEMYEILRKENPDAPAARLFNVIARKLEMTPQGVRQICIRKSLYTPPSASTTQEKD